MSPGQSASGDGPGAKGAAFYDMDGTLVRTNLVHSYLFFIQRDPSVARAAQKLTGALTKLPAFALVDQYSRVAFNRWLYRGYAGLFRDYLEELAEEHFEEVISPNIYPGTYELVAAARRRGLRQVIISGSLSFMVAPLARHLGMDDILTNRLEFKQGRATGALREPIVAAANKARMMHDYARQHGLDLLESYAYSDSMSDYAMLSVVGKPAAVNADRRLRRAAQEMRWPVLSTA